MTKARGWTRRAAIAGAGLSAAACGARPEAPAFDGVVRFDHGVASGDPQNDRVIIWTRVTPERAGNVPVLWVVARNRALSEVVKSGVFETDARRDYTVKIDVTGLRPGAPYFYGFVVGETQSPVGKTRTLPKAKLEKLTMAVASCASYPHGFFNAYEAIAQRDDIDVVVHLGDYIYEYGVSGYGGDVGAKLGRVPSPQNECVSLADYRLRHAQVKAEPELQAAHAIAPWIVVWDDHETANDSWSGGAENHNPGEGDWGTRKQAAMHAYYEWMPIRDPAPGKAFEAINRSFKFGDLLSLIMVESRLWARTKQFDYRSETPLVMQAWDFSNPRAPLPARDGAQGPQIRVLPLPFEEIGGQLVPVRDWGRVSVALADPAHPPHGLRFMPDVAQLNAKLSDPSRMMLGQAQDLWLKQEMKASADAGVRWQVLGNQVVMAKIIAPDLSHLPSPLVAALEQAQPGVGALLGFTAYDIPFNPDAWDGYAAARTRVLQSIREAKAHAIVLSGDSHAAWANEIEDGDGRAAVEFAGTSITSPNDGEIFVRAGFDFGAAIQARNPHIKWTDQVSRGFIVLTLTRNDAQAEYFKVSTVGSKEFTVERAAAFKVMRERDGVGALEQI